MTSRILVIDNYDSFVYNLVQYLGELGADPIVVRNDAKDISELAAIKPDGVLISPGPGRPESAGISLAAIDHFAGSVPVFGVCLGHQAIGQLYGGDVVAAPELMHGKTSWIRHENAGVFSELSNPLEATRYHSLLVDRDTLPSCLRITATSADDLIMGMRHETLDVEGVQFHPESILTVEGKKLLQNFLDRCR